MITRTHSTLVGHLRQSLAHGCILHCCLAIAPVCLFVMASMYSDAALAEPLETIDSLSQEQFTTFSENLSAATHYRSVAPPESLGTLGFDVGIAVSSTDIEGDLFDLASDGDFPGSDLIVPRLHAQKGLPFGIDIGASISAVPDTDITIFGGELRYAIVRGGVVTPAVGLRATYSQIQGHDELDLKSTGVELGISKGFLFFTPYAGVGIVRSTSNPNGIAGLTSETYEQRKVAIGATVNVGFALTFEADLVDDIRTYSAKAGIRF